MNSYHHALSSAQRHGGRWEDYYPLHVWFDESKALFPDFRHRALRHHTEGIFLAERIFGPTIANCDGKRIPTRVLAEQHVKEDLGRIPTVQDWLECLAPRPWMMRSGPTGRVGRGEYDPCECEQPGWFYSGVPGVLARMEQGRLAPGAAVERCDLCQRYASDEAARQKLHELGMD